MSIGLPTLEISFYKAAEEVANRDKAGIVGIIVRDATAGVQGVHVLTRAKDIPATLGADNAAYVKRAFIGTDLGAPSKVILVVAAPEGEGTDYFSAALTTLEHYSIDYLCADPDVTAAEITDMTAWVAVQRDLYRTVKAVVANTAANSMGVVNIALAGDTLTDEDGTVFTSADYCSRFAGIFAGIPSECSCTGAELEEVVSVGTYTSPDTEVDAGKLFLIHDGISVRIARGVNSLTTIPTDGKEDWKKIKIVETMDLITYFCRTTIEGEYRGRCANTYDNKCLLVTAIGTYLTELEGKGILQESGSTYDVDVEAQRDWLESQSVDVSELTDQEIKEYNTGAWVFLAITVSILDAMEDFVLAIGV